MKTPDGDVMIKEVEEGTFFDNFKFVGDDQVD